jgi:hypothetical protein
MQDFKSPTSLLIGHHKLNSEQCPNNKKEKEEISKSTVPICHYGSLMYDMACTRPGIVYAVGVVSRFMINRGEAHQNAMEWILKYLRDTSRS